MDLTTLPIIPTSAGALLSVFVLLVFYGKLVPRALVEDLRADRDMWKQAYTNEQARSAELTAQMTAMMEVARTTEQVMRSLPGGAHVSGGDDETISS